MTDRDTITRTRARAPGAEGDLRGGAQSSLRPDTVRDNRCDYEVHEGWMQTGYWTAYAGSTLRANDGETSESLKFSLEGVGQPSHGHAKQRIENEWSRWS